MAGLFDNLYGDTPSSQAELALAAGLLAGRGNFGGILGRSISGGQGAYNEARTLAMQQQLGQAQMADINAQAQQRQQAADQQRRMMGVLGEFFTPAATAPQPSAASQALGATANAGMPVGPTPQAAAVQQQIQSQPPQQPAGAFNPYQQPGAFQKVGAIKALGGPDLTDQYKLAVGGIPQQEGTFRIDPNNPNAPMGYVPKVSTSQSGQTSVTRMGPNGQLEVSAPKGAMETYAGYQGLEKLLGAGTTLHEFKGPGGEPRLASTLQILQNTGGLPALQQVMPGGTAAPVGAPRGGGGGSGIGMTAGPTARALAETEGAGKADAARQAEIANSAASARTSLSNIGLMKDMIDQNGFNPGAGAELFNTRVAPWLSRLPGSPFGDQVASYQDFAKNATQLSTGAARSMGAREPGSVIQMFRGAYPNADMQKSALQVMLTQQEANQHYAIARQQFTDTWQAKNGNLQGADAAWNKNASQEAMFYMTLAKNYPEVWKAYFNKLPAASQQAVASRLKSASQLGLTAGD